jgi:hypothetical protein
MGKIIKEFKTIYSTRKIYPSFERVIVYKTPIELTIKVNDNSTEEKTEKMYTDMQREILLKRSLKRTKEVLRDITLSNQFDLFCTFTFKDFRDDVDVCKARMHFWLKNQQKRQRENGEQNFDYLIVPEYHKDGASLHFHALLHGYTGELKQGFFADTGKPVLTKTGLPVYDIMGWHNGWASASKIDNSEGSDSLQRVAKYIGKYITKDMPQFSGKKRYWCSNGLIRPEIDNNVDLQPYLDDHEVEVTESENYIVYVVKKEKING